MKKYRTYIIVFAAFLAFCITICFIPIDASKFIPQIESQAEKDLGIKIHIEKLILRFYYNFLIFVALLKTNCDGKLYYNR